MTGKPDVHYHAYSKGAEYRIRPNPDAPLSEGYRWGAWIEFRNGDEDHWRDGIFICQSVLGTLGLALIEAGKDTE